jgi:CHRD domain
MRKPIFIVPAVMLLFVMALSASALANGDGNHSFEARLKGYEETPAINSAGAGQFSASVNSSGTTITYRLSYSGLSSAAAMAHIHFGQRGVAGGVVAFLCGGGNKPACPASGTVTGTIVSSDIIAVPAQGIAAGDLASVLKAMRAGLTYANVHTTNFANGEIRGQIRGGDDDDDD